MRAPFLFALLLAVMLLATRTNGQDTLVIKTASGKTTKRSGNIVSWKGNRITIDTGGRERQIDASRVSEIQTLWPEELGEARQLMSSGKFAEAIARLEVALKREFRQWVKAICLAELIQCYDALEQPEQATVEFLRIYSADPETRFFHLIPLPWKSNNVNQPGDEQRQKWLAAENKLLRLLGASWSLYGPDRTKAIQALQQLADDEDQRIAQLAATQLWRSNLFAVKDNDTERWARQIGNIEGSLRAGPLVVLAEAQQRTGQAESAMINWMKIPILYPEKKSLAAWALFACGTMLENAGESEKALLLYRELVRDFPGNQYAESARQKL